MEKRVVSHSAPYGHACMSCFKGKCRCIPRQNGDGCERCSRLKKHCVPSNQVRRRTLHHGPELDGRITNRSNSEGDATTETQPGVQAAIDLEDAEGFENAIHPFSAIMPHGTCNSATPEPSGSSPAACLDTFRSQMLPHFPFVHLPAHMTAQQLHLRRPFLSQAITCVASSTTRERVGRATELKRVLHGMAFYPLHRGGMLPGSVESTLDLLLGLLIYVAWGWDHWLSSRFTMLATSLVGEIDLDRSAPSDAGLLGLLSSDVNLAGIEDSRHILAEHGLEYQRAVLACFLLSAAVSAYSGQIDALRWTPQLQRALVAISNTDSQDDHILAVQVRLQLLTARAAQIRDQGHKPDDEAAEILLMKLEELRPAVEQHQKTSSPLTSHFHHTELAIHEALDATAPLPVVVTACPPPSAHPTTAATTTAPPPNLTHLWNSLLAIQSATTALLSLTTSPIPASSPIITTTTPTVTHPPFRGLAFPQWAQLTRCLAVLHRFEAPDARWPDGAAREVVDLSVLLDTLVERLEEMAREAGEVVSVSGPVSGVPDEGLRGVGEEGSFMKLALGLRGFRERVLRERAELGKPRSPATGLDGGGGVDIGGVEGDGMVLAPQKGYFRNPRFWLNQIWDRVE